MNTLYYGDNLEILRNRDWFPNGAVDLIYLDPPFNSKRAYNVIFKDKKGKYPPSQIEAFDDTWQWSDETEEAMWELSKPPYPAELYRTLDAFRVALGNNDMMAYLVMMAIRLLELKRVLKKTGSIYLHCDPTASHYLKIVMDQIFGVKNFRNEIVWHYQTGGASKRHYSKKHDIILFYSKTNSYLFHPERIEIARTKKALKRAQNEKGARINKDDTTKLPEDVFEIQALNPMAKERLGYPTQKPLALLERIIQASSNEGDIVLDPFCGCGTTVAAAEKLGRKWLGIDITILAINLIEKRMKDHFPDVKFKIEEIPNSVASAKKMASTRQGKFLFEQWFVTTLGGQPFKSSGGGDTGIDGFMNFRDINNKPHTIIVSVKGGGYGPGEVRDLKGVIERENAEMGLLLALINPTKGMLSEAASAGRYQMPEVSRTYPKIQIFTVEDYFKGIRPDIPDVSETLKKAKRIKREREKQKELI
ncbi:site-specific DNA-methyltransferase [bacterium]|nr:site-specific DNA-methyltransferase [bacterium]